MSTLIGTTGNGHNIVGEEVARVKDLKSAKVKSNGLKGDEAIKFDKKTQEYVVYSIKDSDLSLKDFKGSSLKENIVAFVDDKVGKKDKVHIQKNLFANIIESNKSEFKKITKDLFPNLQDDKIVQKVLNSQIDGILEEINKLPDKQKDLIIKHLSNLQDDLKEGLLKLFLIKKSSIRNFVNGKLLQRDNTGQFVWQHMVKIVNGTLPKDLIFKNEYDTKRDIIGEFTNILNGDTDIVQGSNNCGIASVHYALLNEDQATYIRMATDLILKGKSNTPTGTNMKLPKNAFYKKKTYIKDMMEGALNGLVKKDYDHKKDKTVGVEAKDIPELIGKVLRGKNYKPVGYSYLEKIADYYYGRGKDKDAYNALIKAKNNGKMPAFAGVLFEKLNKFSRNKSPGVKDSVLSTFHVIVIKDIDITKSPPEFVIKDPNKPGTFNMSGDKFLKTLTWAVTDQK